MLKLEKGAFPTPPDLELEQCELGATSSHIVTTRDSLPLGAANTKEEGAKEVKRDQVFVRNNVS